MDIKRVQNDSIETRSTAKTYVSLYFIKKTYYQ